MRHSLLAALLLSVAAAPVTIAQDAAPASVERDIRLLPGRAVADSLPGDTSHTYTLDLAADQFVLGRVDQHTVDVIVRIHSPSGTVVGTFDSPARGPETFTFTTDTAGVYRIAVSPFEGESGRYGIVVQRVEPVAAEPAARVDQIMSQWDRDDYPGGLVAVVRGGDLTFTGAYGMANLTHSIPFTAETRTNIGSTSKQFTAFAILLLERDGRLTLDDDIREYIPELPDLGSTVSLRHLLTHTSGYREFLNTVALAGRRFDLGDHIAPEELISVVQHQPELQNAPGSEWNYNNTGYGLLAQVVERVGGKPFPEWMAEHVFEPVGMTNTFVRAHPRRIIRNSSMGYSIGKDGEIQEAGDLAGAPGAGGIYTTVGDLAMWVRNFREPRVGDSSMLAKMTTRYVLTTGDTTDYGLGVFVDSSRGLRRIHHGGADIAHRSMLVIYPDLDVAVIALSNHASFNAGLGAAGVAARVSEAFIGDRMADTENVVATAAAAFDPDEYDPESFDSLVGHYSLAVMPGVIVHTFREEDELFVQLTDQPRLAMVPSSDSTFSLKELPVSLTFHRNPDGSADSLTLHQNGNHVARKIESDDIWRPTVSELTEYTGRFYSGELGVYYHVLLRDSSLVVKVPRTDSVTLAPAARDEFTSASYPVARIEFERGHGGSVVGFTVSNGRTRGVRFVREE